jgi:hypothetical protein
MNEPVIHLSAPMKAGQMKSPPGPHSTNTNFQTF